MMANPSKEVRALVLSRGLDASEPSKNGSDGWAANDTREIHENPMQEAVTFLNILIPNSRVLVGCSKSEVTEFARSLNDIPDHNFLVEPISKGTGPIAAMATSFIHNQNPNAMLVVVSMRHSSTFEASVQPALLAGTEAAGLGSVIVVGTPLSASDVSEPSDEYSECLSKPWHGG